MKKIFLFLFLATFLSINIFAQSYKTPVVKLVERQEILLLRKPKLFENSPYFQKKRAIEIYGASGLMWGSAMVGLNELWYKDIPHAPWHAYNDFGEWEHIDKLGHAHTAYFESKWMYNFGRWAGVPDRKAAWIGALAGWSYQFSLEMFDAYSAKWGFSPSDIGANTLGCGLFLAQQLHWKEQRIKLKYNLSQPNYPADAQITARVEDLYGKGFMQKAIKDYNAQSYWLSFNIKSFLPNKNSNFPSWLNLAVGYGADGMLGGYRNEWILTDAQGITTPVLRHDIKRIHQFYIAPDIDLSKIRTRSHFLKMVFEACNIFKFPAPALEINSQGKVKFHPMMVFNFGVNNK